MYTTKQVADMFGSETWRVRRLFEDGTLPEPEKFGGKRAISKALLPSIREALIDRGWARVEEVSR